MNERDIFIHALQIADPTGRSDQIRAMCAGNEARKESSIAI